MNKKIFSLLLIITLLIWALPAMAETLELKCDYETGCDLCDAVALIAKVSKFILSITGSLALLIFVIGGLFLIISQGNSNAVNQGKKMIVGAVLGLIIVFAGWGIVNLVIAGLTGQMSTDVQIAQLFTKPWNELECVKPPKPIPPTAVPPTEYPAGYCVGIAMSEGAGDRCSDASSSLISLLNCIKNNNTENLPLMITSISSKDYGLGPGCESVHSVNSCHCQPNGSMAADLRSNSYTNTQQADLSKIVESSVCGGRFLAEADHFHISTGDCRKNY
ncbi:MAG: pilin [bacterium]